MPKITVEQAVKALGIDVPVMACRMVGGRLELHLYGGRVAFYPEVEEETPARKSRRTRSPKDPHPSPIPALKNSAMAREKSKP